MAESKFICETHTGESEVGFIIPEDTFWKRFYEGLIDLEESIGDFDAVTHGGVRIFHRSQGNKVIVAGASYKGLNGWKHLEFPKCEIEAWELLGSMMDLFGDAEQHPPGYYNVKFENNNLTFEHLPCFKNHNDWVNSILKIRKDYWM